MRGHVRSCSACSARAVLSCSSDVDSCHLCAAPGEPGADVRRTAAELDHVSPRKIVRERPQVRLRHLENAPGELVAGPGAAPRLGIARRVQLVPVGAVAQHVVGQELAFRHVGIVAIYSLAKRSSARATVRVGRSLDQVATSPPVTR
jgi:hypothetical protein